MDRRIDQHPRNPAPPDSWAKVLRIALLGVAPLGALEALIDRVEGRA